MATQPKRPWYASSAQSLANEHLQPTYIVIRNDTLGSYTAILFEHELEDPDLPNVLWGFWPTPGF